MWRTLQVAEVVTGMAVLVAPALAFDLQGHRGARGLAPENTLAGFERAVEIGVSTLELDIGITADGVPVIVHDRRLDPALVRDETGGWLGGRPLVSSMTLAQLQRLDVGRTNPRSRIAWRFPAQQAKDGERIPTLAALFRRIDELDADCIRFNIETKLDPRQPAETLPPGPFVDILLQVIRDAGVVDRVTLQSFDWRTLRHAQALEPSITTSCLTSRDASAGKLDDGLWTDGLRLDDYGSVPALVRAAGCAIWSPDFRDLRRQDVQAAQSLGLQVIPWTVNQAADMARLIDWGVDGLITDYPDRLRALIQRRGMALPPANGAQASTGDPAR